MGALVINTNMNEHQCTTHGGYLKFKNDPNQSCPYCEKNENSMKTTPFFKKQNTFSNAFTTVELGCSEHGFKSAQVPTSMVDKIQNTCPKCSSSDEALNTAKKLLIDKELAKANVPMNTRSMSYDLMDKSSSPKQHVICETLVEDIKQLIHVRTAKNYRNLFITGNMGTGKTLLASVFLKNIIVRSVFTLTNDPNDVVFENNLRCFFTTESQLIQDIKDTWKDGSQTTTKRIFKKLSSVPILCIDDVGSIESSTHLFEAYTAIIDERYKRNLPTIMTSNVSHADLGKVIGSRSADRFLESDRALVINCDWQGYRQRKPVQVI
nr:ATP-binding protein [uncultured Acinetobacter sp.]